MFAMGLDQKAALAIGLGEQITYANLNSWMHMQLWLLTGHKPLARHNSRHNQWKKL
ncbi:hypothetical protein D3C76_1844260 [compost metagenome]